MAFLCGLSRRKILEKTILRVTCVIIEQDGLILAAQRRPGMDLAGQWEFPGGKVQPGETDEACLIREIGEELRVPIALRYRLPERIHCYPGKTICLVPFVGHLIRGQPTLTVHQRIDWFTVAELPTLNWCAADVLVVADYIQWRAQLGSK